MFGHVSMQKHDLHSFSFIYTSEHASGIPMYANIEACFQELKQV